VLAPFKAAATPWQHSYTDEFCLNQPSWMAFRTLVLATLGLSIPWSCCSQNLPVDSIQIETVPERIKGVLQNFTAFCTSQSSSKQPCSATVCHRLVVGHGESKGKVASPFSLVHITARLRQAFSASTTRGKAFKTWLCDPPRSLERSRQNRSAAPANVRASTTFVACARMPRLDPKTTGFVKIPSSMLQSSLACHTMLALFKSHKALQAKKLMNI